jgi:hypothetical protein
MRPRFVLLAACAFVTLAATPASACFAPYSRQLFEDVPDAPAGTAVIRVAFTNQGEEFRTWRGRVSATTGTSRMDRRRLVGVARRLDGQAGDAFPVYARVTSCTPDFDGDPPDPLDRHAWLVGRFQDLSGQRVFVAISRGADGEWESLEAN